MRMILILGFAWLLTVPAYAKEDFLHGMSATERKAAGIDKLSAEEQVALNEWLNQTVAQALDAPQELRAVPQMAPATPAAGRSETPKTYSSRIVGQFSGWDGKTRFHLQNGQVWQQRTQNRYRYKAEAPEVRVYQNLLGFWELEVVATGRSVGVKVAN